MCLQFDPWLAVWRPVHGQYLDFVCAKMSCSCISNRNDLLTSEVYPITLRNPASHNAVGEFLSSWMVQTLSQQFPESDWIVAQAAVAQYNLRNFDDAQELFEDLIERDPHRVEVRPLLCAHVLQSRPHTQTLS